MASRAVDSQHMLVAVPQTNRLSSPRAASDAAAAPDILVDGDVQEGVEYPEFHVKIHGGGTRTAHLPASIVLKNESGIVLRGVQVKGVSFIAPTAQRVSYDPARWTDVTIADNIE